MDIESRIPPIWNIRSRLRIRHLELLLALEELRSLHKASTRMNMTQSAASKLLQEVETMFGVPLFVRSRQGVTPTQFGSSLLQKATLLLAELDAARDEIESLALGTSGRLRVGAQQVVLPVLVPQALARLRMEYPNIAVLVREGGIDTLLTALERGELDCVLGRLMLSSATGNFRTEVLYDEPVCVVARVGHPLAKVRRITPALMASQSWIVPPRDAPLRHIIEQYFVAQGLTLSAATIESISMLNNNVLMRDTDLVAAMPLAVARYYDDLKLLSILHFRPNWVSPPVGIVKRAVPQESAAFACFVATLRAVATEMKLKLDFS